MFYTLYRIVWRDINLKIAFMDVKSVFGKNLKLYRKAKKLSQEQLSEKVGISAKHLSALERGVTFVSADLLEKLALSVNVPISRFFVTWQDVFGSEDKARYGDGMLDATDKIIDRHLAQAARNIKSDIRQNSS